MKKLIYTLFAVIGFASISFAQTANTNGNADLVNGKTSGEFEFTLPSSIEEEKVTKAASYYTSYFTVNYDAGSHKAKINMVNNESKSRYVIGRFLSSCEVREVEVDGENIALHDFMEAYLK